LNNNQQLNNRNNNNVTPLQQRQPPQSYPSDRTFSSDTGIEADVDDDQYFRSRLAAPTKSANQINSEQIRQQQLQQFQQRQRQLENQANTQRTQQQPRTNPNLQRLQQQRPSDSGQQQQQIIRQQQAGSMLAESDDLSIIRNLRSKLHVDTKQQQRSKSSEYNQFIKYESTEDSAWESTYGIASEIRLSSGKVHQNKLGGYSTGAAKQSGRPGEYTDKQAQFTAERKSRSTSNKQRQLQREVTPEKGTI